jgi:hypothetical protein
MAALAQKSPGYGKAGAQNEDMAWPVSVRMFLLPQVSPT